jgi:tRNA-2-methylthio-N6-dimethylallyladenosine synthase
MTIVKRIGFTGVFGFKYSERPYTPALKMGDDVSEEEKTARFDELFDFADTYREQYLATLVGSQQAVLVEGRGKTGAFRGRTERNEIVHFACAGNPVGEIVPVNVVQAFRNSLSGELDAAWVPTSPATNQPLKTPARLRSLPVVSA